MSTNELDNDSGRYLRPRGGTHFGVMATPYNNLTLVACRDCGSLVWADWTEKHNAWHLDMQHALDRGAWD